MFVTHLLLGPIGFTLSKRDSSGFVLYKVTLSRLNWLIRFNAGRKKKKKMYYPTPSPKAESDTNSIFKWSKTGFEFRVFISPRSVTIPMLKSSVYSTIYP